MVIMSSASGVQLSHHGHGPNPSSSNATMSGLPSTSQEKLPSVLIERPKMPRATWDALRNHILRERQKKKQEQEQSQEVERIKKEREHKKKQEALTIEETKEELANAEIRLTQLKEEKHQLFHTLKKVLYEDDRRRSKEVSHSQVYLQPSIRSNPSSHYMKPQPHLLMPQGVAHSSGLTHSSLGGTQASLQHVPQAGQKRTSFGAAMPNSDTSSLLPTRSPSPPRSTLNSAYYRTPPQVSNASKFGAYSSSAVASVSAAAIYAHPTNPVPSTACHYIDNGGSKPVYLTQAGQSMPLRYNTGFSASHHQPQQQSAPPSTQQHRSGSIMTGYPRTVSYTAPSSSVQSSSAGARLQPAQPQQHSNGPVRYYQREV